MSSIKDPASVLLCPVTTLPVLKATYVAFGSLHDDRNVVTAAVSNVPSSDVPPAVGVVRGEAESNHSSRIAKRPVVSAVIPARRTTGSLDRSASAR